MARVLEGFGFKTRGKRFAAFHRSKYPCIVFIPASLLRTYLHTQKEFLPGLENMVHSLNRWVPVDFMPLPTTALLLKALAALQHMKALKGQQSFMILEWFGLDGTSVLIEFQSRTMGRVTFH